MVPPPHRSVLLLQMGHEKGPDWANKLGTATGPLMSTFHAKVDRMWTSGDPWQYLACLPSPDPSHDPFEAAEQSGVVEAPLATDGLEFQFAANSSPDEQQDSSEGEQPAGGAAKRAKKAGLCRLLNSEQHSRGMSVWQRVYLCPLLLQLWCVQ